jgi:hypothetical protein
LNKNPKIHIKVKTFKISSILLARFEVKYHKKVDARIRALICKDLKGEINA